MTKSNCCCQCIPKFSVQKINNQTRANTYFNFSTFSNLEFRIRLPINHDPLVFFITLNITAIDYKLKPGGNFNIANDIESFVNVNINENFVFNTTWRVGPNNGRIIPQIEVLYDQFGTRFVGIADETTSQYIILKLELLPDRYIVGRINVELDGIFPKNMNPSGFKIEKL